MHLVRPARISHGPVCPLLSHHKHEDAVLQLPSGHAQEQPRCSQRRWAYQCTNVPCQHLPGETAYLLCSNHTHIAAAIEQQHTAPHTPSDTTTLPFSQALAPHSSGADDGMPAALQPGPQSMVQLMGAWGKLSRLIEQQAALWQQPSSSSSSSSGSSSATGNQPTALILNALKLAVGCLRDAPARRDGRTPVERALDLAAQLAGLCSSGLPLDAACIAAGIVAEAVELRRLHIRVVEVKLGTDVAALVRDILRVRSTPQMVQLHDDDASRWGNGLYAVVALHPPAATWRFVWRVATLMPMLTLSWP